MPDGMGAVVVPRLAHFSFSNETEKTRTQLSIPKHDTISRQQKRRKARNRMEGTDSNMNQNENK